MIGTLFNFKFHLLQRVLLKTWKYSYLFNKMCSYILNVYPVMGLLNHMESLPLFFWLAVVDFVSCF